MEYAELITADSITQDFSDTAVTAFDNLSLVPKEEIRRYNYRDYQAKTNIYELATYSWNDISSTATAKTIRLADKVSVDSTVVPCTQDVTTIYVIDSYKDNTVPQQAVGKFFVYTGVTGNVDFTTIDPSNPANFTEVINYREFDIYPEENPLFWKDLGAINSRRLVDGIIGNQTIAPSGSTMTYEFIFSTSINAVAFFNLSCKSITITEYRYNETSGQYDIEILPETTYDMISLEGIIDSYTWHTMPVEQVKDRLLIRLPIYAKTKVRITFENISTPPEVGEIIFGRTISIGTTIDSPTGTRKGFSQTQIQEDGTRTVKKSKNIIDRIEYEVIVPTKNIDNIIKTIGELLEDTLLIIGDESGRFTVLFSAGYVSELPFKIKSRRTENIYSITVNTII